MATRGPHPKDDADRQRRNAPVFERTELGAAPAKRDVPALPKRRSRRAEVREWWDDWVKSSQASQFGRTDWRRLLMLVPLVDAYWKAADDGDGAALARIAAELRLQEAKFGATPDDRMRLRWVLRAEVPPADGDEPAAAGKTRTRRTPKSGDPRLELVKGDKG